MKILAIFLSLCSTCLSQTVEVKDILTGADGYEIIAGQIFVPPGSKLAIEQVGLVTVPPEWVADPEKCAQIIVEDGNDDKIPYVTLDKGVFQINGTGIIKVQIVNPSPFYFNRWKIVLGPPAPPPVPPPVPPNPPNPPNPPTPSPVDNTYGVGKTAYDLAPRNAEMIAKYAKIYEQAGEFLFGRPSLKAIAFDKPADSANPDRSVLAWMNREINNIPCPDLAVCQQWKEWQTGIRAAFTAAQANQQFTTKEWYGAFNEVAAALRKVQ